MAADTAATAATPAAGRRRFRAAGAKYFCGRGGTGFVSSKGATGNYIDALLRGDWLLPAGTPALIVVQGGGNDATSGASNSAIVANAERLIGELQRRYPGTRMAMIGTLARGEGHGEGRRSEVDALLGSAADHGPGFGTEADGGPRPTVGCTHGRRRAGPGLRRNGWRRSPKDSGASRSALEPLRYATSGGNISLAPRPAPMHGQ